MTILSDMKTGTAVKHFSNCKKYINIGISWILIFRVVETVSTMYTTPKIQYNEWM